MQEQSRGGVKNRHVLAVILCILIGISAILPWADDPWGILLDENGFDMGYGIATVVLAVVAFLASLYDASGARVSAPLIVVIGLVTMALGILGQVESYSHPYLEAGGGGGATAIWGFALAATGGWMIYRRDKYDIPKGGQS